MYVETLLAVANMQFAYTLHLLLGLIEATTAMYETLTRGPLRLMSDYEVTLVNDNS